ncbi:MAG: prepilin-type N-terminal cleavage/methylation domain-containing protein [Streptococcaceae bacterium]|nr:prepilin-type N-terminal cleavage/methylation domain-containing protein [Streptococcaceae bacterium]
MKKLKKMRAKAFTLIEMLIVLVIISVLILLFVPNLSKHKTTVEEKGQAAVIKVVESQGELYELNIGETPTLKLLQENEYITEKQVVTYKAYYTKNKNETAKIPAG